MKFTELELDAQILAGVAAAGFEECTPVQARAIPLVLQGKDVMVQSQTGTGKTAAFMLPVFHLLRHSDRFKGSTALVIAPTRELAVQIKEEADMLSEDFEMKTEVFHGGVGYHHQQKALSEGLDIIVGTPGRLIDLSQTGHLDLKSASFAIIDEADRLLDMGFYPDLRRILRRMKEPRERLNMLFSATLSVKARNLAWDHMNEPVEIEIEPEHITVEKVNQELYHVASEEKMPLLLGLLRDRKPHSALIFTNTKRMAEEVAKRLERNGFPAEFIIGDLPQKQRLRIIRRIKAGETAILVATDVAARGLHIDNLELVVNYDLPEDSEAYVHRIGRTARAGESGTAISLACERFVYSLESIEKLIGLRIPAYQLSDEVLLEDVSAGERIYIERYDDRRRDDSRGRRSSGGSGRDGRRSEGGKTRRRPGGERRTTDSSSPRDGDGRKRPTGPRKGTESRRGTHPPRKTGGEVHRRSHESTPPKQGDSLEKRLEFYRRKYGEDFQPTDEMLANVQNDRRKNRRRKPKTGSRGPGQPATGEKSPGTKSADTGAQNGHGRSRGEKPAQRDDKKPGIFKKLRGLFGGDPE